MVVWLMYVAGPGGGPLLSKHETLFGSVYLACDCGHLEVGTSLCLPLKVVLPADCHQQAQPSSVKAGRH